MSEPQREPGAPLNQVSM